MPTMLKLMTLYLGTLNAESFCERIISAGNLVQTSLRNSLASAWVSKLSILRINLKYMKERKNTNPKQLKEAIERTAKEIELIE